MTEFVAVADGDPGDLKAFHTIEEGTTKCGIAKKRSCNFVIVPIDSVDDDLELCKHCSGEAICGGGQGSELAAKLAKADPDEVSAP